MSAERIGLGISIAGFVISATASFYEHPMVGAIVAGLLVAAYVGYLVYVMHNAIPGNTVLRLAPAVLIIVSSGVAYYFWPATLTVALYEDANQNGRRDDGERAMAQEEVIVIDSNNVRRTENTGAKGDFSSPRLPPGDVRLRIRGYHVLRDLKRGDNLVEIGFMPPKGTPPEPNIFVSSEPYLQLRGGVETQSRKVYAHIYFADKERPVKKVEIDWGEGKGSETLDLTKNSNLKYYLLPHEYESSGPKTVRIRLTNSAGLTSDPAPGEIEVPGRHFDSIIIRP